jgi:hypothetical protein
MHVESTSQPVASPPEVLIFQFGNRVEASALQEEIATGKPAQVRDVRHATAGTASG